ncbi:peptidylprolyl isomerase [Flexivirga aerilata]|uniref:peptidylprolyl isomerase n=1 Tax=Flexivirga aerilata TaxID=1656889 RepID=UPI0031B5B2E2
MRLTRTRSVLGACCLVAVTTLTACGSSSPNPNRQSASLGLASAEAVSGITCTTPPTPQSDPPTYSLPDKATAAGKTFVAKVVTNCGVITFELDGSKAPQTVASFVQLAGRYWNDSPCHRVTTSGIFVLQCGDPTGTGNGTPGYGFGIENAPATGLYPAGSVAMARTQDPNSNGGQFFIVYADTQLPTEGGGYSIFGKVTGGLDIVQAVAKAGTENPSGDGPPKQPVSIIKVTVTEKKA